MEQLKFVCQGYFKHKHRTKLGATLCGIVQDGLPMSSLHFYALWIFKHWKLKKILHAGNGRNRRAMHRRIQRGKAAI